MELWTAFVLGFAGSLHCAGMCGPLVLALPEAGATPYSFVWGRLAYNGGRLVTYSLLGAVFGVIGRTLALAGLQRWVCLGAGAAILLGLGLTSRFAVQAPATSLVAWLKSRLGKLLRRRSFTSLFGFGILNGFLPCGLVYVACAGAVASGGWLASVEYMLVFGLGTVPMMLSIGLAGKIVPAHVRLRFQRIIPACLALVGFLLILRGMSLGIPYLSPNLSSTAVGTAPCH